MHGKHRKDQQMDTRPARFENIQAEVEQAFEIHASCGSRLGGVHLELDRRERYPSASVEPAS